MQKEARKIILDGAKKKVRAAFGADAEIMAGGSLRAAIDQAVAYGYAAGLWHTDFFVQEDVERVNRLIGWGRSAPPTQEDIDWMNS